MRPRKTPARCAPQAGFSMVEISISAAILALLSMGAVVFFGGAMESMDKSADSARVLNQGTSGVMHLEQDLAHANPDHIWIESQNDSFDVLYLQVPVEMSSSGPLWGAVCPREVVNAAGELVQRCTEWKIRYRVQGTQLIRDIVDAEHVAVPESGVIVANDLLSQEALLHLGGGLGNQGTSASVKVFKVHQVDPQTVPNLYAVRISTAAPEEGPNGQLHVGPIQAHRATIRANRH